VVAFYCQIIIGMDADTYKQDGGNTYYEAAQEITNVAQSSGYKGWNQGDTNQNRFWLVNNIMSNTFVQFRDALYTYHFEGLDQMHSNLKLGKEKIIDAISKLSYISFISLSLNLSKLNLSKLNLSKLNLSKIVLFSFFKILNGSTKKF
jgi:hypothetical protein